MFAIADAFSAVMAERDNPKPEEQTVSDPHGFKSDIPYSLAVAAHSGTSFVPEKRAESVRNGYAETLASVYAEVMAHAKTPEQAAEVEAEFARLREGYGKRYRAYLSSQSRTFSTMISGPANFPVRQMEKRNRVVDSRRTELLEFLPRAKATIIKAMHPELRPIMSGDADATERLAEKIATAEQDQLRMKAANAVIRKNLKSAVTVKHAALVAAGFGEDEATKILTPNCFGGIGFASFELTNNNANIIRMKGRLAVIGRNQTREAVAVDGANARMEDCPADNRVRLFFPGKPDADVRTALKSCGFRWSPTIGAWQAYRNERSIRKAREVAA